HHETRRHRPGTRARAPDDRRPSRNDQRHRDAGRGSDVHNGVRDVSPRVLLVDDEANIRRMVGALLQSEGFETAEAANGTAAIDGQSRRAAKPFVTVSSAAIPKDLVESEMFGHEKGSFTGASERRLGRFELADTGTLFLDEVGDLGAEAQAKLLRVLESGVIERVGGERPIQVDVRVIAATNKE